MSRTAEPRGGYSSQDQSVGGRTGFISRVAELPTEHVQEFKVVWSRKKQFHTVPVERAHAPKYPPPPLV